MACHKINTIVTPYKLNDVDRLFSMKTIQYNLDTFMNLYYKMCIQAC